MRNRTVDDPPALEDCGELHEKLEQLASTCTSLHFDTRYLPHERRDELYKVQRTLMRMTDVDRAIALATELDAAIRTVTESMAWVVLSPSDQERECYGGR